MADMRTGVGGALVEANAGYIARRVGIEPDAQLNGGVGANARRGRCSRAGPDRTLCRSRSSRCEGHVHPVVGGVVRASGELTGTAVSIGSFRSCTRIGVGVQR